MAKKIYGAPDKLDWVCEIHAGGGKIRLAFSGGATSGYGATPARFVTANPAVQAIIETSRFFRDGAIVLLKEIGATPEPKPETPRQRKEFADWESARDWAVDTFSVSRTKVRTREALTSMAATHGYDIIVSD